MRTLVAIPVFNEARYVEGVLARVLEQCPNVLIIDDGSTDATPSLITRFPVEVIRHSKNRGYGKSLKDAMRYSIAEGYDWLITMDCDEQHEPAAIPHFLERARAGQADIISGSRYLLPPLDGTIPPPERRAINATITAELNDGLFRHTGTRLTDAFCGFKAHRVESLRKLRPTVSGYAFPMQFWVQAVAARLRIEELPVRLIYNDLTRTFGGQLDDATLRLTHYRHILHREMARRASCLPSGLREAKDPTVTICQPCILPPCQQAGSTEQCWA